ncbi:DUF3592 domain-containing protein [Nonomuraea sp. NPDC049784]|uniref:DUF3592 domain-containing protein n=1 Tax=Nonomuraea sp. NPDC049784 TaxID=3154361 RepID=UPI003405C1CF
MRNRLSSISIHRLSAIALILVAIGISVVTVKDYRAVERLRERGVTATATVADVRYHRSLTWTNDVVIRYTTRDGVRIEATISSHRWSGILSVGESHQVVYDPADPEGNVMATRGDTVHVSHAVGGVAVLLLVLAAVMLWWRGADAFRRRSR